MSVTMSAAGTMPSQPSAGAMPGAINDKAVAAGTGGAEGGVVDLRKHPSGIIPTLQYVAGIGSVFSLTSAGTSCRR